MNNASNIKVLRWWQSMFLPANQLKEKGIMPASTAHKANLKRCESSDAVMLTEGFRALWLSLGDDTTSGKYPKENARNIECWATISAVLVHVKKDLKDNNGKGVGIAQAAGKKGDSDKSVVSELRFAQLQNAKTPEDFLRRMRRIVQQLKGEVSVVTLAADIQQWFSEHYTLKPRAADKRIAVKWAMDYYRAASVKTKK